MQPLLYLIVDPMCSWCWGFRSPWQAFLKALPESVVVTDLMGGLAPDTDQPMEQATREYVQQAWRTVGIRTGATFNFEFWQVNQPRRSTYPACRAVIAAGLQEPASRRSMYDAIQHGYFLEARNPSDLAILAVMAGEIGLDTARFSQDMRSSLVQDVLEAELKQVRALGVAGFPTVIWHRRDKAPEDRFVLLSAGYADVEDLLARWQELTH